jgi:hypothetical protein
MTTQSFKIDVTIKPEPKASSEIENDFGLTSTLRKSYDDDEQIITCVAMEANVIDAHGDLFLPSAVKMAAHGFLADYNLSKWIGKQHDPNATIDADLIGSFYLDEPATIGGLDAPGESWITQIKINDQESWVEVRKSEKTGLSIQGKASGYYVNDDIEKSLETELSKARAGESEFTKPKRVFHTANPTNLDLVDEGANLHCLVWKAKDITMETTKETIETEAVAKAVDTPPSSELEASSEETVPEVVASGPVSVAPDALGTVVAGLQKAQAIQGLGDIGALRAQLTELAKALGGTAPEPKAQPKAEHEDLDAKIAKAIAASPLAAENAELSRKPRSPDRALAISPQPQRQRSICTKASTPITSLTLMDLLPAFLAKDKPHGP